MSERGTFIIDRGLFSHPVFADEPFTEREAWMWLIGQAAWKAHERRVGRARVKLARGELAHATRFMATAWKWSQARVRRFLAKLTAENMIRLTSGSQVTQITICNYDDYQLPTEPCDDKSAHKRLKVEEREERKKERDGNARAREGTLISEEAHRVADECRQATGNVGDFCGLEYQAQMWLGRGYEPPQIVGAFVRAVTRYGPDKPMNYITKAVESACVRERQRELPLPPQVVGGCDHETTVRDAGVAGWQRRRDDWRATRADFKAGIAAAESASDCGSEGGRPAVRSSAAAGR